MEKRRYKQVLGLFAIFTVACSVKPQIAPDPSALTAPPVDEQEPASRPGADDAGTADTPPAPPPPFASGSRLRANVLQGDDGSRQFLGTFHDAATDDDCTFRKAPDGVMRCLPELAAAPFYADPQCNQPIMITSLIGCSQPAPKYVTAKVGPMCGGAEKIFAASGAAYTGSDVYTRTMGAGNTEVCVKGSAVSSYAYAYVGAEIPVGTFVAGQVR